MRTHLACLPLSFVVLAACPGDDEDTSSTTVSMTTTASTGSTTDPGTESGATDTGSSTQAAEESSAGETTGPGPEVCETCDPATEICFASIIDGPTEYSCRPIPGECTEDVTCECIVPIECSRTLQSCGTEGELVVVECVEG